MVAFEKIALSQTNCFLFKSADGYLLVDCGGAGDAKAFLSAINRLGLSPSSISTLLLTHHHSDHCGLLPLLLSENPHIKLMMSEPCAAYLETGRHFSPDSQRYAAKSIGLVMALYGLMGGKLADTFPPYFCRPGDVILQNAQNSLPDFLGIGGTLLHTPGHTWDSTTLIIGEDAFVGDAARSALNFCGAPYEPILYYDRAVFLESWKNILSSGVKTIHPAHGSPFPAVYLKKFL